MVTLSHKESRVLKAYLRGAEVEDISRMVGYTVKSTHALLVNVCRKFGFHSRTELHDKLEYTVTPPRRGAE